MHIIYWKQIKKQPYSSTLTYFAVFMCIAFRIASTSTRGERPWAPLMLGWCQFVWEDFFIGFYLLDHKSGERFRASTSLTLQMLRHFID